MKITSSSISCEEGICTPDIYKICQDLCTCIILGSGCTKLVAYPHICLSDIVDSAKFHKCFLLSTLWDSLFHVQPLIIEELSGCSSAKRLHG